MIDDLINKTVPHQFWGEKMTFHLSMGLFSSNSVDSGTMLLLKSIARELDFSQTKSLADIGCGVGVIGIGLKKKFPNIEVICSDRDALAVRFTEMNASVNKAEVKCVQSLMLSHLEEYSQDYIFSNIPAKAGEPVLRHFVSSLPLYLSETGKAAVVIVNTLADNLKEMIEEAGFSIDFKDASRQHTVYHFSLNHKNDIPDQNSFPYIRHTGTFDLENTRYKMETVYNIPDFDTPGYNLELAASLLSGIPVQGSLVFLNPGQGHLPVWQIKKNRSRVKKIILTGRDLLQLKISERNLASNRYEGKIELEPVADIRELMDENPKSECELFCADIHPIPGTPWADHLTTYLDRSIASGNLVLLTAKSADLYTLLKSLRGYTIDKDKRMKGRRAVLLRKV